MNVLNNLLRKKSIKIPNLTTNIKDLVKTFAKYITETKNQIKERKLLRKEKESDSFLLKHKINEFIKNNFKEKGYKNDPRSFFLILAQELYKLITNLLYHHDITKCNNLSEEAIISFIKSFYDFEDELYITSEEIINKVIEGKADDSFIIYLSICLSYLKLCEVSEFILDKENDISDIGVKIVILLSNFHCIAKFINEQTQFKHKDFNTFINLTMNHIIQHINNFFIQFMDDTEMKTVFMLIEYDYLGKLFNDISEIKIIRKYLFDLYIKVNIFTKDGIKIRNFKRYILENKCLEGVLSNVKKNYSYKTFEDISEIFNELIYLLLLCNAFYENQKEIKQEIFNFLLKIFGDLYDIENIDNFKIIMKKFIQEIFYLSMVDKEDFKSKFSDRSISTLESTQHILSGFQIFRDNDILNFLLTLFDFCEEFNNSENSKEKTEFVRITIFKCLLDSDLSLNKYKYIVSNTNFCNKVLENLHKLTEEMISYPLSSLIIIISDLGDYTPDKELKSILKSLIESENDGKSKILLKHLKNIMDISNFMQKLLVQCGFFQRIVEIFNKTIVGLDYKTNKIVSPDVLINILSLLDQVLSSGQENIMILKNFQLLENYFERFIIYPEYKHVSYKIWSLLTIHEPDEKEIFKHTKFLYKRYNILKDILSKCDSIVNFKLIVQEIYQMVEINSVIVLNENFIRVVNRDLYANHLNSKPNNHLKEILLGFIYIIENVKNLPEFNSQILNLDTEEDHKTGDQVTEITKEEFLSNGNDQVEIDITEGNIIRQSLGKNDYKKTTSFDIATSVNEENKRETKKSIVELNEKLFIDIGLMRMLKEYIIIITQIIANYNKFLFTVKFKSSKIDLKNKKKVETFLTKNDTKNIISQSVKFFSECKQENSLKEYILFLVDLSIKNNTKEIKYNNHFKFDYNQSFSTNIKDKYKINQSFLNFSYELTSTISNIILDNPLLIKYIYISTMNLYNKDLFHAFLEFLELIFTANENNIKNMLRINIVKYLLISIDDPLLSDKILEIFHIICKYFSQNDLQEIYVYLLRNIAENSTLCNRLLNILIKNYNLSRKIRKSIVLSNVITKQCNNFNMLYTGNLRFINNKYKETNKQKQTHISIFMSLSFHNIDYNKNDSFVLFRFERDDKSKDIVVLDISIEGNNLIIKENEREVFSCDEHIKYIRPNKKVNFLFIINKESNFMEIFINEKLLFTVPLDLKLLDLTQSYNLITGYSGSSTKEVNHDNFLYYPHVNLSYIMIYGDKITSDKMIHFKLSQIFNSKNGSCRAKEIKLKSLNKKKFKMIATNSFQDDILKNVNLNIDPSKVIYELIVDDFKLLSNNKLQKLKIDQQISSNFYYKIHRKYSIDVMEKHFLVYIPNTNYYNDSQKSMCHTYLLTKCNLSDYMMCQNVYDLKSITNEVIEKFYKIHLLELSTLSCRFIDYCLTIMNDCVDSNCFFSIIKLLGTYLLSNIHDLFDFCQSKELKILLIIFSKKSDLFTKGIVDYLYNLSLGTEDISGINFFNPLFPRILIDVILDFYLFKFLNDDIRLYILEKLINFLNHRDYVLIMYESNYEIKVAIILKCYKFLMLIYMDNKVEEEIINLLNMLLEQTLKFKKGDNEPSDEQLNKIVNYTQEYFLMSGYFPEMSSNHIKYKNRTYDESVKYLMNFFFKKFNSSEIKSSREKVLNFFTKLFEDINHKKSSLNLNSKVLNLLNPSFFLRLYNKEVHNNSINNKSNQYSHPKHLSIGNVQDLSPKYQSKIRSSKSKSPMTHNSNENRFSFPVQSKESLMRNTTVSNINPINTSDLGPYTSGHIFDELLSHEQAKIINYYGESEQDCLSNNCQICNFVKEVMKINISIVKNYLAYKKLLKKSYYYIHLKSYRFHEVLKKRNFSYSVHLMNCEGPGRIRNRLKSKLDILRNEELNKRYYDVLDKSKVEELADKNVLSNFNKSYAITHIHDILDHVFYTDQILNLNIVRQFIDRDDQLLGATNCLFIKNLSHINCVFIITVKRIYILKNVHIDAEGNLLLSKIKFKKYYWSVNDYKDELKRACPYLNNLNIDAFDNYLEKNLSDYTELTKNISNKKRVSDKLKMSKFTRDKFEFEILKFEYKDINEIHKRRYLLKPNSLEFFLKNGKNYFITLNLDKRDLIYQTVNYIFNKIVKYSIKDTKSFNNHNLINSPSSIFTKNMKIVIRKVKGHLPKPEKGIYDTKIGLEEAQEFWEKGIISNYEYLMLLNMFSGRSYNDLSQYFIMPWILKDYSSDRLNLNTPDVYRDLQRPIHAIEENNYQKLVQKYSEADEFDKFHSGSHYSTPGFVTYFLIRLKPFSFISAEIQGGYFDMADRLFCNIKALWDVPDKYQELIPEMFFLPELCVNYNQFDFGKNQNQMLVNDVILPTWAKTHPRLFVKMNKKALESSKISERIHEWIDLIFGYKQQGKEAVKSLNVFRSLCYEGKLDIDKLDEKEREDKMIEIHDFGQIPIQLFTKSHPKKECHEKSLAFFSKPSYLINFAVKEKTYSIDLTSKPFCFKAFYESDIYLSQGKGGLSAFRIYNDNSEKSNKHCDAYNTFIITGKRKLLLGPRYVNYIDWNEDKYSFSIVQPLNKISCEFQTGRECGIRDIKATRDGKRIIIGFSDGVMIIYKLYKERNNQIVNETLSLKKEKKSSNLLKIFTKTSDSNSTKSSAIKLETIPLKKDYIQPRLKLLNDDYIKDYHIHYNSNAQITKSNKGSIFYCLKKIEEKKLINNTISLIEICEEFSLMIVTDTFNNIYLFDLRRFDLIREIFYKEILKRNDKIFQISICNSTGDFITVSCNLIVFFNINGVINGTLDLNDHPKKPLITYASLKSIRNTQSELHLFTGHQDGNIIMWRVTLNKVFFEENLNDLNIEEYNETSQIMIANSFKLLYNEDYYKKTIKKKFEFKLKFDDPFEFNSKINSPIRLINFTEDCSTIISIHDNLQLCYWSYEEFYLKKNKLKTTKLCPQCNNQTTNLKYSCSLCKKKICGQCKIVEIVPEISLKNQNPVCNDCLSMICSTNKMLYDFA